MQLHQLRSIHKTKKHKRVGRGGKRGTYSGKGIKGQRSRAGAKIRPHIRDLIKNIPKLRGVAFKSKTRKVQIVKISLLEKVCKEGDVISPAFLLEKRLIRKIRGRVPAVKLLGGDALTKHFFVTGCKISVGARKSIENAGGKIQ